MITLYERYCYVVRRGYVKTTGKFLDFLFYNTTTRSLLLFYIFPARYSGRFCCVSRISNQIVVSTFLTSTTYCDPSLRLFYHRFFLDFCSPALSPAAAASSCCRLVVSRSSSSMYLALTLQVWRSTVVDKKHLQKNLGNSFTTRKCTKMMFYIILYYYYIVVVYYYNIIVKYTARKNMGLSNTTS